MKKYIFIALLVSVAAAAFLSPLASQSPDGLERVAQDKGFSQLSEGQEAIKAPMADYLLPGVKNETMSGSLAGVLGTLLVFAAMYGFGKLFMKRSPRAGEKYEKSASVD